MIIIDNEDGIIEIIDKINTYLKHSNNNEFLNKKNKKNKLIYLYIKSNHPVLTKFSKLQLLKDSFEKNKIFFEIKGEFNNVEIFKILEELKFRYSISGEKIHLIWLIKFIFKQTKKFIIENFFYIISGLILIILFFVLIKESYNYSAPIEKIKTIEKELILNESLADKDGELLKSLITLTEKKRLGFLATNINLNSSDRAVGNIIITNKTGREITIIEKTRLKAKNGSSFKTLQTVKIPPTKNNKDGILEIGKGFTHVIADIYNQDKKFIGEKGNIKKGTILELKSKTNLSKNIQIITKEDFYGGKKNFKLSFYNNSMDNIKNIFISEMKNKAIYELNQIIEMKSIENSRRFLLLEDKETFNFFESNIFGIEIKEDEIIMSGTIKSKGYYVNADEVIKKILNNSEEYENKNLLIKKTSIINKSPLKVKILFELQYK